MGVTVVFVVLAMLSLQQASGQTTDNGEEEPVMQAVGVPLERQLPELDAVGEPLERGLPEQASGETASDSCRSSTRERLVCFQEIGASQLDQIQANLTKLQGTVAQQDTKIADLTARLNLLERGHKPASCSEAKSLNPHAGDGEYTLYPFTTNRDVSLRVYCHDMASGSPKEFLSLPSGPDENYAIVFSDRLVDASQWQCTGGLQDPYADRAGTTKFSKIRIQFDTSRIEVIRDDYTFAQTTGPNDVDYGHAGDCYSANQECAKGTFKVNLTGTELALAPEVHWVMEERYPESLTLNGMFISNDRKVASARCGGWCGHCWPAGRNMFLVHPQTSCPQNNSLVLPSGKTYFAAEGTGTYSGAQEECRRRGGIVAIPRNEEEQRNLVFLKNCVSSGDQFWIGVKKTAREWVDGKGAALGNFTRWARGEPDDFDNGYSCAHIVFGDKVGERRDNWADASCLFKLRYVCEIEGAPGKKWREDGQCGQGYPAEDGSPAECDPSGIYPCCSPANWCGITADHCDCPDCVDYRNPLPAPGKKWREDGQCGQGYPAEDGTPAECDPSGIYPCCSPANWCGITADHCDCPTCVDYRKPLPELCQVGNGTSYRGQVSMTETGKTCQRWDSQTPHEHEYIPADHPSSGLEGNYCRNPAGKWGEVWCYTTDPGTRWERCDVPTCGNHSLVVKTSATTDSQSGDFLTIEVFSADCEDVCASAPVYGLTSTETEYKRNFDASNFGVPTRLRLTASGKDWLKLDWVDVYNAYTGLSHRFRCPPDGCQLSTDTSEGSEHLVLDLNEIHGLKIKTSAAAESQSADPVTIEIFSADCADVCTAVTVSGLARAGTEYNRTFAASNFGVPTRLRLTASGEDWLKLDWVDVYNAHTERSHHFSCPSDGCQLSADTSEGSEQIELDVDVCPSGYVPFRDGERCFKFSAGKRNYTEARSACQAAGGHLALPKDQATNDFLVNQINDWYPPGFSVWFGLTDQVEEGTFVWEDGTPLGNGWNNWAPEQPDDYQSVEDCAEWKHEYGYKWNDFPCNVSRYYVCEVSTATP